MQRTRDLLQSNLSRQDRIELGRILKENMKFSHFSFGPGHVTVAGALDDYGAFHYGIAFCSPTDNFSRKEGRERAMRKLLNLRGDPMFRGTISDTQNRRITDLSREAIHLTIRNSLWKSQKERWYMMVNPSDLKSLFNKSRKDKNFGAKANRFSFNWGIKQDDLDNEDTSDTEENPAITVSCPSSTFTF